MAIDHAWLDRARFWAVVAFVAGFVMPDIFGSAMAVALALLLAVAGLLTAAFVINAATSGPFPRYQNRLVWPVTTLALIGVGLALPLRPTRRQI